MYEPKKMKETDKLFRLMGRGQVPDFWEVLAAINEISDLNAPQDAPNDGSHCRESSNCSSCG